ncbi:hypothetical protein LTR53_006994 [Teratosphaeriaceae sp. CCFEE 6253]|nr:hypothetical protein LTR53_006994 [Teratosphaeriaceae sp. CCFEE 6253]
MSSKQYVWLVERCDFDHHEDDQIGRSEAVSVHATLESANESAAEHLAEESELADEEEPEIDEDEGTGDEYQGTCYTREDGRNHFTVTVRRMSLYGYVRPQAPVKASRTAEGARPADHAGEQPRRSRSSMST